MKKNTQILKDQVKELKELVRLKNQRIQELETQLHMERNRQLEPAIAPTYTEICFHEYPSPWLATIPPSCTKCGKQAPDLSPVSTISAFFTGHEDIKTNG